MSEFTGAAFFGAVFTASILGSGHCVGMCGGLVALSVEGHAVGRRRAGRVASRITPHALHAGGRVMSYAVLGAVSGTLGAAVDLGGRHVGFGRTAAVVAGLAMVLVGLMGVWRGRGLRAGCRRLPAMLQRWFARGMTLARRVPPGSRPLVIGLLTGLLPCGWLYAFVLVAAGTGSAGAGALTMVAFWAGTVPALVMVGVGVECATAWTRRLAPAATAWTLIVLGLVTIAMRFDLPAYAEAPSGTGVAIEGAILELPTEAPCCDEPD